MEKGEGAASDGRVLQKDSTHANTRVIIIGGGIGGLAAALALARRGFAGKNFFFFFCKAKITS